MKRILVTGCAGYLGNVLCDMLWPTYEIIGVDNLYFGQDIPKTFNKQDTFFVQEDITKSESVKRIFRYFKPDAVIHLAGMVGMSICAKNPELAIMVNTESTRLILENLGEAKLISANTNSQYGTVDGVCDENTPTNPISLYAVTKCLSETLILNKPNTTVLRLATVYGVSPRMRDELLINYFVKELVKNKKLEIFEGNFRRGAVYIKDVARAFMHCLENNLTGVFNLNDDSLNNTKIELAKRVSNIVGGFVTEGSGKDPDQRSYNVVSNKLFKTGFKIESDFTKNIRELQSYYKNA